MECQYTEEFITAAIISNLLIGVMVITLSLVLLYFLHIKHHSAQCIDSIGLSFRMMTKAVNFGMYPVVIILGFGANCRLRKEDVVKEYEKDSMERRNVIYTLLGRKNFSKKFIEKYPSQFMLNGYEGEHLLLKENINK